MKTSTKLLALILVTVLLFGTLCACQNPKEDDNNPVTHVEETKEESKELLNGNVRGKVLSNNGDMLVSSIIIVDEHNNSYLQTTNEYGGYHLRLQPGKYHLTFTKGFTYSTYSMDIEVESLKTYYIKDIRLSQLYNTMSLGWLPGDLHQHTTYSDGADSVSQLVISDAAANMLFGFITDHNTSRGVAEYREATINVYYDEKGNRNTFLGLAGDEITTEFGHFNSLGTGMTFDKYEINFTESERASSNKNDYARQKIIYIADTIKAIGGVAQMNHPYSLTNMGAMNFLKETDFEAICHFDTMEIWNAYFVVPDGRFPILNGDNQNYKSKMLWYSVLNNMKNGGSFVAATAGTDNHDSSGYASGEIRDTFKSIPTTIEEYQTLCRYMGKYCGSVITFVCLDKSEMTQENILGAIKNGHSFISNGPIINSRIDGAVFGDTVKAVDGKVTVSNNILARDGISEIRFVVNGETVNTVSLDKANEYNEDVVIDGLNSGDWLLIEVLGDWGIYAISNPFFVE